jgi:hypothetical protein
MTTHPTPAERLLAMLADERAFETLPGEDVRAELDAVGVDPARCIAFAHALADGTGSPGGQLLGAIDVAEDEADEITRLESADIDEVRAQIPGSAAAAIAAEARRQAGADSNIVAIKRRRRSRVLRWGGPAAGIAASVLLIVVVGVQFMDRNGRPMFEDTRSYTAAPIDDAPAARESRADEAAEPRGLFGAYDTEERKRSADADLTDTELLAKQQRREAETPAPAPAAPPAGLLGNVEQERAAAERDAGALLRQQGAGTTESLAGTEEFAAKPDIAEAPAKEKPYGDLAGRVEGGAAATVAEIVIVDDSQVPLAVQSQALPRPDLAARVVEARRLAGDRPVIALYRVAGPAGQQDFVQVPLELAMTQQMPAPMPLTQLLGPEAFEYDFLAMPEQ